MTKSWITYTVDPIEVTVLERSGGMVKVVTVNGENIGIDPLKDRAPGAFSLYNSPIAWINERWLSDSPDVHAVGIDWDSILPHRKDGVPTATISTPKGEEK
jgi:hypothetical protein